MTMEAREAPAARRLRRRRARRRVVLGVAAYVLILGVLSAGCLWGYFWLLRAPVLRLAAVDVHGLARLEREQVLSIAGVSAGAPLVALDLKRFEDRLERLEWVGRARARLTWPLRLAINVEEKAPVALIRLDSLYYLDKNARLIKRLSPLEGMDYPVITGIAPRDFEKSRNLLCSRVLPLLAEAAQNGLRQADFAPDISELNTDGAGRLVLYTTDGLSVKLGDGDYRAALKQAGSMTGELRRRGLLAEASIIDVSCPQRVFVKFHHGPTPPAGQAHGA
jgi:cell division protein FtsQ